MSAATETVMTPTLPMEAAPAKVVKKRGPKKKTAKEADKTDKNTPIETEKKMTSEKEEKEDGEAESQEPATKKTRAPALSANNKRFVQFTYFLLNKLKDTHPEIDTKPLYDTFKVFDSVEEQLLFLNTFDQDAVKSSMKQHKVDLKKDQLEFAKQEKKLATKIKRTKNVSPFYEADNVLVSISFNGADVVDDPKLLSSQVVLDALKLKTNHTKTQTQTQTLTQTPPDIVAQIVSAANNHTTTSLTHTLSESESPSESESLDVQLCKIQDNTFLIDKNNNLYHPQNHNLIATFHTHNNTIQYI
jgi:hypothetical protein